MAAQRGMRALGAALAMALTAHAPCRAQSAGATPAEQGASQAPDAQPDALPATQDWAVHGQATLTEQYHPAFTSPYRGPNSLDPGSRGDETFDATAYFGLRPWHGAEIWITPEIDQGFGLSNTLGVAGFTSGEAYKVGAAAPYVRLPQLYIRQTIDLGGAVQGVEADLTTLAGRQTANRLVLWAGKFGVGDVFDTNPYAHDPRNDFLNWTVIDAGAFDYAADAWGFSYGGAAEWYQDWWTLRAGLFDGSREPNSKFEAFPLFSQYQVVAESEARYRLLGQDGTVKLTGYWTRAKLANFTELLSAYAIVPDATEAQLETIRHLRNKFGGALNLAQPITADIGLFLRASLDDGRTEAYEFTDVDKSLSGGVSVSGGLWGRKDDTLGLAAVVNTIDHARKTYLEDGGLGILVGDGKLPNAGPEQILEAYYNYKLWNGIHLTLDNQVIKNPAYNRDRGPVDVLGARLHAQF